jgi:hypothetical protein
MEIVDGCPAPERPVTGVSGKEGRLERSHWRGRERARLCSGGVVGTTMRQWGLEGRLTGVWFGVWEGFAIAWDLPSLDR